MSSRILVTGAAGFIGSNLVKALNDRGVRKIIAVDNLSRADKFRNLVDCDLADYIDKHEFLDRLLAEPPRHRREGVLAPCPVALGVDDHVLRSRGTE